jgi:hypothetical protein
MTTQTCLQPRGAKKAVLICMELGDSWNVR